MNLDNWFDLLFEVAPGVEQHKAWLTKVRDQALTMFDQVDEDDDPKAA
jgi:hypothetical protein